ncbi:MAG: hypothetical protein GY952_04355 [Rhodobacteraceae bacterium]|nr:hypothetical protein [Paracoccaceae bacterium]
MTDPIIRLHLFFATDNSKAVILRQGPSKTFRMVLWDRADDTFEDGQWLKHKVYVDRCDLSPDGEHFVYFALDGRWKAEAKGSYTAISRPPYFTALALFPQGDTWGGGGCFLDSRHYYIYSISGDLIGRDEGLARVFKGEPSKGCTSGLRLVKGTPAPFEKPTIDRILGRLEPRRLQPLDKYDTQGGCLYRRSGGEMKLIRDFTKMEFEYIRAPYDWRSPRSSGETPAEPADWHPLDKEGK